MESSSSSSRRELQIHGPRPAPLKIRKDSHKIKKPPPPQPPPQRSPVIIYSVSPKVIHTNPADFMTLVQRLTGLEGPAADPPAARVASFERTEIVEDDRMEVDDEASAERSGSIPGILSPAPSSLPPIPPGFFSPSFGPSLSPPGAAAEGGFLYSPGSLFVSTPVFPSPGTFWDLFNQLD